MRFEAYHRAKYLMPDYPDHSPYGPSQNRIVICMKCYDIYQEQDLVLEKRFDHMMHRSIDEVAEMWWCRNKECDGVGMNHDIYPLDNPFVARTVQMVKDGTIKSKF